MAWLAFGNINRLMIRTILPAASSWLRIKTAHTEQPRVPVIPLFSFYYSISQFSQKKFTSRVNVQSTGGGRRGRFPPNSLASPPPKKKIANELLFQSLEYQDAQITGSDLHGTVKTTEICTVNRN